MLPRLRPFTREVKVVGKSRYAIDPADVLDVVVDADAGLVGSSAATTATIEALHAARRVASHARSYGPNGTTVTDAPQPRSHRRRSATQQALRPLLPGISPQGELAG